MTVRSSVPEAVCLTRVIKIRIHDEDHPPDGGHVGIHLAEAVALGARSWAKIQILWRATERCDDGSSRG